MAENPFLLNRMAYVVGHSWRAVPRSAELPMADAILPAASSDARLEPRLLFCLKSLITVPGHAKRALPGRSGASPNAQLPAGITLLSQWLVTASGALLQHVGNPSRRLVGSH